MKTRTYLVVSAVIFALVGLAHLIRLAMGVPVQLGDLDIPFWVSGLAIIVCAAVAGWGVSLARRG